MQVFSKWLESEIDKKGWSKAEFSKHSGIDSGTVSNLLNEIRKPGPDTCRAIAKALAYPEGLVFYEAGLLSENPYEKEYDDPELEEMADLFNRLSDDDRAAFLAMLQTKVAMLQKNGKKNR